MKFIKTATALLALCLSAGASAQEAWPSKPLRLIVPFAPGGTSDILARSLGERLQLTLKQTVVVENKAGAGGVIGADAAAKSPGDGYTLLLGTIATHAINPALQPKMPYDAVKDFAPVFLVGSISNVLLVGAGQPYKSAADVIAAAKARPGALVFGSPGQGTSQHLSGETLKLMAGIDIIHVPYKGSGPATQDLVAGQIPMTVDTALVALPHIQAGKIRALAVTSGKRTEVLPNVPTLAESGVPGFDVSSWQAIFVPAATPPAIIARLNHELAAIVAQPEMKAKLASLGVDYSALSPAQFGEFQRAELAKWQKIVKDGKLSP